MAVSQQYVASLFQQAGVPTNYSLHESGETAAQRIARITNEINSGTRTVSQVQNSISYLSQQVQLAGSGSYQSRVENLFNQYKVPLDYHSSGAAEDPAARLQRIAQELASNDRSWAGLVASVQRLSQQHAGEVAGEEQGRAAEGDAFAVLRAVLDRYGLGTMANWVQQEIQKGRSINEILLDMREHGTFKERFKAIGIRKDLGLNTISPEEIIQYENTAKDLMRASGLPEGFYDHNDDFAQLIGKGVSLQSLQDRIDNSWRRVVEAPPEVQAAWEQIYGMQGRQAMATFMFDPDQAETKLREMAATAVVGGAMTSFGFGLQAQLANRIGKLDLADSAVREGFSQLARLEAVFNETVGETTARADDLRWDVEGANAIFDGGEGMSDIDRRLQTRRNEFAGGGGAFLDQRGLAGVADS